jgi:hypothetical protein
MGTPCEGDFDADGDVDASDLTVFTGNYHGNAQPAPMGDHVSLAVDLADGLTLEFHADVCMTGYSVFSVGSSLDPDGADDPSPFHLYLANDSGEVAAGGLSGGVCKLADQTVALNAGWSGSSLSDLIFKYSTAAGATYQGQVIPEPSTIVLLATAAVGLLLFVRRR